MAVPSVATAEQAGSGEVVVLVHGFPLDRALWRGQSSLARHLRLVSFDLPGFGEAEPPPTDVGLQGYSAAVVALLDALEIETATLCGLSMGGYVLFDLWRRAPHRIRRLVLCDTRAEADSDDARRGRQEAVALVQEGRRAEVLDGMLDRLLGPAARGTWIQDHTRSMMQRASDEGIIGALRAMMERPDSTPDLAGIAVPTLVMVGERDVLTPPADAAEMQRQIPNSRLVEVPGAGHLSPLENPEAFNRALLDFVLPEQQTGSTAGAEVQP